MGMPQSVADYRDGGLSESMAYSKGWRTIILCCWFKGGGPLVTGLILGIEGRERSGMSYEEEGIRQLIRGRELGKEADHSLGEKQFIMGGEGRQIHEG